MRVLGIDVGASGIKGAPVDTRTGRLLAPRRAIDTPHPATPAAIAESVGEMARHFRWKGAIGCTIPAVVQHGRCRTSSNISDEWLNVDVARVFRRATGSPVSVMNDADAAGYAEVRFGAGRGVDGVVIVVTLGTGIGTALFIDGRLVPNTELGQLKMRGQRAEKLAAASVRRAQHLSWQSWARRVNGYLLMLYGYFWPSLIIIGGGVSRKSAHFIPRLTVPVRVSAARLHNDAGIIGAALAFERERQHAREKRAHGLRVRRLMP